MKRFFSMTFWLLIMVQCAFASGLLPFGLKSLETGGKDETFAYSAGDVTYIFGAQGEGLIEVWKNGQKIYDFGTRPAWFMLKYMHQTDYENETYTTAKYYYPQLGNANPKNNFTGLAVDPAGLPHGVLYVYEFTESELANAAQEKTMVGLYFVISAEPPLDGVMVYISVWNYAGDSATDKYRLMEVHCPYVRLPKIGNSRQDDVVTISNYLLEDPISTFKPIIEPYEFDDVYKIQSGNYPSGFQVKAYYDQGEHPGRGVYMAMYNISRETAQNTIYKHQGGYDGWGEEWLGDEQNWPVPGYRDYLLWDIVRFTTDINQPENDYAEDLFVSEPPSESWNFCTFMKFYDSGLDWFGAATKYLDLLQLQDGVLSVVFGDGTMDYDTADAVTVLTGVKDFSLGKISSQETVDIVCITQTGIEVLACDQTGEFDTILASEGLFSDAIKIAQILESEAKYIVQDGSSLKQISITAVSGGKDNEFFDIVTDEILCEPVRTFSIDNLCSDDTMDMVTITEDGSVELLNWSEEIPESMVVIEIGTGADAIAFDDTDNDSDLDIILENSSKNVGPDVLTYVGDWKFTPED